MIPGNPCEIGVRPESEMGRRVSARSVLGVLLSGVVPVSGVPLSARMAVRVAGGGWGDGGVDADLVVLLVVEHLQVERVVELLLEPCGGVGEDVSELGQRIQQVRVGSCGVLRVQLGGDGGAFFFELGETGDDPGSQCGEGGGVGVVQVGQVLDFAGVGGLGRVDLPQSLA